MGMSLHPAKNFMRKKNVNCDFLFFVVIFGCLRKQPRGNQNRGANNTRCCILVTRAITNLC